MFYSFKLLFYNIIKLKKDITEKSCLVVLHGLAGPDGQQYFSIPADAKNAYTSMNKTQYHKEMIHVLTAIVAKARPGFQPISRN
jgi:hypothetical protein